MGNTDILSIQLYTLRSLGELDRVLDTVKQAGYGHVETVGSQLDELPSVKTRVLLVSVLVSQISPPRTRHSSPVRTYVSSSFTHRFLALSRIM